MPVVRERGKIVGLSYLSGWRRVSVEANPAIIARFLLLRRLV
jgi:hypothetical protein